MKSAQPMLMLVLLNVAWLAAASWYVVRHFANPGGEPRVQFVTNYVPVLKAQRSPEVITNVVIATATNDFRWTQLESEDYRTYVTRLRSIGCPEQTIRDIVIADVDKLLAPRMQAATAHTQDVSYWKPIEQALWEDAEQKDAFKKQRAVDFEKREVIRELLGVDLVGERLRVQGQADYYGQRLGFLPEDKRARARLALDQFSDEERVVLEQRVDEGGSLAGNEQLAKARQEMESSLAQLFTPQERDQYDLWFSSAASTTRDQVYGMNASEEEFLKLYQLRKSFAQKFGDSFGPADPAWKDYQGQIQQALGDQRYADFIRAQDPDYRDVLRVATRFRLAPELAGQLYSYKQTAQEAQAQVESDSALTLDQRSAATQAIADETQRAFKEALGEKAFRNFMQRSATSANGARTPKSVAASH